MICIPVGSVQLLVFTDALQHSVHAEKHARPTVVYCVAGLRLKNEQIGRSLEGLHSFPLVGVSLMVYRSTPWVSLEGMISAVRFDGDVGLSLIPLGGNGNVLTVYGGESPPQMP